MPLHTRTLGRALLVGVLVPVALSGCSQSGTPTVGGTSTATGLTSTSPTTSTSPSSVPTVTPSRPTVTTSSTPSTTAPTSAPSQPAPTGATTLLGGLDTPWSIAMLPDGSALVSERDTADIHLVPAPETRGRAKVVGRLPGVHAEGEGGLLGLAVPVDFDVNPVFYAYYSTDSDNRIAAVPWRGDRIGTPVVIFSGIPRGRNHNGGRIAFGPDGDLYVGTGDAGDRSLAQNLDSLGGKILRITPEGAPAPGNPFGGSPIWSYGHRNVQGLAWDKAGHLYASELGADTWDELNRIEPGKDYGWPDVEGKGGGADYTDPIAVWRPAQLSPSGIAVGPDGAVYIAALRGQSVWRVPIGADGQVGAPTRHLQGAYGRIRDIRFVDGRAWILTSNGTGDRLLSLPRAQVGAG
ncbi:glucose sorbosone dehydrogenase [Intrasporangium oryzae NRRL B-24470]|uniref:Glucose sorbosone dehydrogenase n=1 Tax=Intrasporangium oryzae NRRL B-24470 TaxID=1386089 RepID=W9GBN9_9MICO|nr:PQQ-dependent sugar dehydrogenase [Intrasporangium oryzae]EWT02238.1 glucose sorbosone dehydrogenase [Intrasporangium oryzae NRRL B-24470]